MFFDPVGAKEEVEPKLWKVEQRCKSFAMLNEDQCIRDVMASDQDWTLGKNLTLTLIGHALRAIMLFVMENPQRRWSKFSQGCSPMTPVFQYIRVNAGWRVGFTYEADIHFHESQLRVCVVEWLGAQPCPFQKDKTYLGYKYGCRDIIVMDLATRETLVYSDLGVHMLIEHKFNQTGHYRIDLDAVLRVVGPLTPEYSYEPIASPKNGWLEYGAISRKLELQGATQITEHWAFCIAPQDDLHNGFKKGHLVIFPREGQVRPRDAKKNADIAKLATMLVSHSNDFSFYFMPTDTKGHYWELLPIISSLV